MRLARHHTPDPSIFLHTQLVCWIWILVTSHCLGRTDALFSGQTTILRKETEDLFYHGFENYMKYAFPEDELRPLTCKPLTRDRNNSARFELNDVLGNYSLTLIDSLSTLAILASSPSSTKTNKPLSLFQNGIRDLVIQYGDGRDGLSGEGKRARGFDLDSKVQVFETAIRGVGGLLSAHLFAIGELPIRGYTGLTSDESRVKMWLRPDCWINRDACHDGIKWPNGFIYDGQLLRLAYDLANRLIPAFQTPTGIPYPRVNLKHGISFYASGQERTETCSAGAGSLTLEFTVLSRLTGDNRFEDLAKHAFWQVWDRRSGLDLVGNGIDAVTGDWVGSWTGIGAGVDSFYEYAFKSHILLSRDSHPAYHDVPAHLLDPRDPTFFLTTEEDSPSGFLTAWDLAHAAIERHLYRGPNFVHRHYIQTDYSSGAGRGFWIDSLSAYFPGLLALAGHVQQAIEAHLLTTALWTRYSALPERWNVLTGDIEGGLGWWIGRPEFIESTYYIFRATEDPWYVHVGEMVLRDIKRRCWTKCGWAGLQNVVTGEKNNRMESFFLGETAKYLFLLFDLDHPLNKLDDAFVFSTEGHPLLIPRSVGKAVSRKPTFSINQKGSPGTCPVKPSVLPFTISSTAARGDVYHAGFLARWHLMPERDSVESFLGEYAQDHPSITSADLLSPSNYSYFPWTLPPELVPPNAMSSRIRTIPSLEIKLPAQPNPALPVRQLLQVNGGLLIQFIGGVRLSMIRDVPMYSGEKSAGNAFRIQSVNEWALGRDEKVFLPKNTGYAAAHPLIPSDPILTRIRDGTNLKIVLGIPSELEVHAEPSNVPDLLLEGLDIESPQSTWDALVKRITSLLGNNMSILPSPFTMPPDLGNNTTIIREKRLYLDAVVPAGIGAAPLPDWVEAPSPGTSEFNSVPLLWSTIFTTDQLCLHKLPLSVPQKNQVLIVKSGGCTLLKKLSNIPAVTPSPSSLQLVIMVADEGLEVPTLDEIQRTSTGVPKPNPVPMVMVTGGDETFEALESATGLGIKRKYSMLTQGVPISNLHII